MFGLGMAVGLMPRGGGAADDPPPISVDAEADKSAVTVGDLLTFSVTLRSDPDIRPASLDFSGYFKGFDLVDSGTTEPERVEGQVQVIYWYRLRADQVGAHTIPSVPVTFTAPDPQRSDETIEGQILTPEVAIEVKSILYLQGEPTDIRDIKSLLPISGGWINSFLFALALLLVGLGLWFWRRGRSKPSAVPAPPAASLRPHELALKELRALNAKGWIEQGRVREYYFELSEIFRRYLGNRYAFPAIDWTTEEILQWLNRLPEANTQVRLQVKSILQHSDQVKFAKAIPSVSASNHAMESILQFIQFTRPPWSENAKTSQA